MLIAYWMAIAAAAFPYVSHGKATSIVKTHGRSVASAPGIQRVQFHQGINQLTVEFLSDKVIHFEISTASLISSINQPVFQTPYIDKEKFPTNYSGPLELHSTGTSFETQALKIDVDPISLCVSAFDKIKSKHLTHICPFNLDKDWKGLSIDKGQMTDVYGLGELFLPSRIGNADGNWINEERYPGDANGNAMTPFHGGGTGNTQFPIMYAVGPQKNNYAIFLDQVYKQNWNFHGNPWRVEMWGTQIRWFLLAGADLPELRTSYMNLVGRPLMPPKKAFGLWISEYGFDSWDEIRDKLRTLRAHNFPVDGFVMDLQWFGGVNSSETSPMGTLRFNEKNFPNPAATIKSFREADGIGLITIEESYVSRGLPEHIKMESQGFLAKEGPGSNKAFFIDVNPWWGLGGMIDWSNPEAGKLWHEWKRQPLIDMGIMGHWTDLGEPEMYTSKGRPGATPFYYGFPEFGKIREADVHNVFSLLWHQSIFNGYAANHDTQRPWILSRSGAPGMQRYGASMWSGDIGSNLGSLATHLNVQMHMSLSGVDYFSSDIGGFHRGAMGLEPGTDLNEMYTQWFANGSAFDFPVRPHTENVSNTKETAPDRIGHVPSNLANIRLRYELSPYYYSLAYRAYLYGEPIVPPLVYYYQDAQSDRPDFNVRTIGHEKLIGRDLLFAVVAKPQEKARDIYLPPGEWIDYYNNKRYVSMGQEIYGHPEYLEGIFRLPLFARAGAIIPKMFIDDKTMNIEGKRSDGSVRNELIARIYTGKENENYGFTVYEDDGRTNAYQNGEVATTLIRQMKQGNQVRVVVGDTAGNYSGAPILRHNVIELVAAQSPVSEQATISLNGVLLQKFQSRMEFDRAPSGWFIEPVSNVIFARSGNLSVKETKKFIFNIIR